MKKINNYDKNAIYTVEYRKNNLEKEFERIRQTLSGYYEPIYTFIEDENGILDSEKIDIVISDMTDALDRYLEMAGEEKLSKAQKEWYKSYLYCVMVSPTVYTDWLYPEYGTGRNFGSFIAFADIDETLQKPDEFIWYENHKYEDVEDEQSDIFFYMAHAYQNLMDKDLYKIYTAEEKELYEKLKPSFEWGINRRIEGMDLLTQIEKEAAMNGDEDAENSMQANEKPVVRIKFAEPEEETADDLQETDDYEEDPEITLARWEREAEDEQRRIEECIETINKWCERIGDKKRFEKEYKKFRKYFFKADLSRMKEDIQHMTDAFLYEQGLCAYSLDKKYGLVDKAVKTAETSIKFASFRARVLK